MLPTGLLAPTVMALRELVRGYGVSIVLCTATQPVLMEGGILPSGFGRDEVREIIPQESFGRLFGDLHRRVRISHAGVWDDAALVGHLQAREQVLCIVNTRAHARDLYQALGEDAGHFHLSALMYPTHRRAVLRIIRRRLKKGMRCRVISTQLVEAGVDIDFPAVYRASAGIDSVAQAAGRCNREGNNPTPGEVIVFMPARGVPNDPFFSRRSAVAGQVHDTYEDVLSPAAIKAFFTRLYALENLDEKNILRDLKDSLPGRIDSQTFPAIPFREIAEKYRFIDTAMEPVIVERSRAAALVGTLEKAVDPQTIKHSLRRLQPYMVQLYPNQILALGNAGKIRKVGERFRILSDGIGYDKKVGLMVDDYPRQDMSGPVC